MLVIWVYVVLLLAGGVMGYLKAGSKVSLITSAAFGAILALCAAGILRPAWIADVVIGFLLVFFGSRYAKTRKFMPGGLMAAASALALVLRYLL